MEKRHRVFVAINLPEEIKKQLEKYQKDIQDKFNLNQGEGFSEWAKWTIKDNLHITLEFLGDLTDVEIAEVCKIVGEVAKKHNSFSINLNKIFYAPPNKMPPKMIWCNGEKLEELAELKNDLQELLLEKINYKPEGRGFTPHITMARINEWQFKKIEPEERPEINEDIDLLFNVDSIDVMESVLKRGGPVYVVLESCKFKL